MPRLLAAADIGSNTVHLLVASTEGGRLTRIRNESDWLSLGEVVGREGRIPDGKLQRLMGTLRDFKAIANGLKVERLYVFATEAMRQASNHDDVIALIRRQLGIEVDLVSAAREAELSRLGVAIDSPGPFPSLLIEVGGGSAQVAVCAEDRLAEERSLPLGTGRLIAQHAIPSPCPEDAASAVEEAVSREVQVLRTFPPTLRVVACGGVARGLWRALHPDGERTLTLEELDYLAWSARRLPIDTICARFGVKLKRAATLFPGAVVYRAVLQALGHAEMTVSEFGVREGAVLEMVAGGAECRT